MKQITEENFILYAAKHYDNVNCIDEQEFIDDLNRIKYVKRLLERYLKTGDIKTRLILNHLVVLYNVFSPKPLTSMLLFKLSDYVTLLKPFLLYLNYWPSRAIINDNEIECDPIIEKELREFDARKY